jgi:hypothetical protein
MGHIESLARAPPLRLESSIRAIPGRLDQSQAGLIQPTSRSAVEQTELLMMHPCQHRRKVNRPKRSILRQGRRPRAVVRRRGLRVDAGQQANQFLAVPSLASSGRSGASEPLTPRTGRRRSVSADLHAPAGRSRNGHVRTSAIAASRSGTSMTLKPPMTSLASSWMSFPPGRRRTIFTWIVEMEGGSASAW